MFDFVFEINAKSVEIKQYRSMKRILRRTTAFTHQFQASPYYVCSLDVMWPCEQMRNEASVMAYI
jgi:CRISPR/Cas system-associated exonuclease Cas4 (RecB family)